MKSGVANSKGIWYRFRSDYICTKKNSTKKSGISYVSPIIKKNHIAVLKISDKHRQLRQHIYLLTITMMGDQYIIAHIWVVLQIRKTVCFW